MAIETTTPLSRRALLGGTLGALGTAVAATIGRPLQVTATADLVRYVNDENDETVLEAVSEDASGGTAISGKSVGGPGVTGVSASNIGVFGQSDDSVGVSGFSTQGIGVTATRRQVPASWAGRTRAVAPSSAARWRS